MTATDISPLMRDLAERNVSAARVDDQVRVEAAEFLWSRPPSEEAHQIFLGA